MPPTIDDLMASFLARRAGDMVAGDSPNDGAEIREHDPVPAQAIDPRLAWDAANECLAYLAPAVNKPVKLPVGWLQVVATLPPMSGLPLCLGNYPQAVRDLLPLVRAKNLSATLSDEGPVNDNPTLAARAKTTDSVECLHTAAMLRLARCYDEANAALAAAKLPSEFAGAKINESAALAWHSGQHERAVELWNSLPASPVKSFNLGMAELFADRPQAARPHLQAAVNQLSESSPWHHLGRLYLALAESR